MSTPTISNVEKTIIASVQNNANPSSSLESRWPPPHSSALAIEIAVPIGIFIVTVFIMYFLGNKIRRAVQNVFKKPRDQATDTQTHDGRKRRDSSSACYRHSHEISGHHCACQQHVCDPRGNISQAVEIGPARTSPRNAVELDAKGGPPIWYH